MGGAERVFAMPDLGEGLEEGEIVEWLVAEGDEVALNQPLVEVETAKATVEIPSPFAGVVAALHAEIGSSVPVGSPLVTFSTSSGGPGGGPSSGPPRATPPVRKLAKELGIDLASVVGTGPDGRVTDDDVRATVGPAPKAVGTVRAAVAANLERQASIPQVTTFRTIDCSALEAFRARLELSPLPVVVAALCRTLAAHPALNAAWTGEGIEERPDVHVGVAADTERGLVVPVLRDAAGLGISAISDGIARLAESARAGSLTPRELTGATIAVSNTGSYGSESGTPILSPGTSVTLALGVIEPRALVVDGEVVARPACTVSCTFDHRALDGATVGRAITDLVGTLTSLERLEGLPR
ncbi:MAG TPA: dihydrolipoamide acetyltransferase family protein [Actinomycetota bacterium]|jgi:pyruvate dehydrogenase E2 component (dihydrolipoamide acetyltransferase)|nr:dihydrolipoamide acetyltransferase family protein [Actinomycetota bacterium]